MHFRFAQAIAAATSTALFVALLPVLAIRSKLSRGTGILAANLAMFSPISVYIETNGSWEATFVPLGMVAVLWAFLNLHDTGWADTRLAIVTGFVLGVGSLLSPVVSLVGMLAIGSEVVCNRVLPSRLAMNTAVVLAVCGLTLAPWIYRNYRAFSAFVPVRSNLGLELALGNNSSVEVGKLDGHPAGNPSELKKLEALGEVAYNRIKLGEARDWIKSNPREFVALTIRRARMFWFPGGKSLGGGGVLGGSIKAAALGAITLLSFGGLACLLAVRHPYRYLYVSLFLGASLPYVVTHVSSRYHYPIVGFIFLLGSECLMRLISAMRSKTLGFTQQSSHDRDLRLTP